MTTIAMPFLNTLGVIHISADAKKAHFGTPLADTMLTFSWDPLADSQHTPKNMLNARLLVPFNKKIRKPLDKKFRNPIWEFAFEQASLDT